MKTLFSLMAVAMTLASASPAFAASSVDLSVRGSITPAAFTPTLSQGGVVEHGKISRRDLDPQNKPTPLPVATLKLGVECTAPTLIAIKSRDNRAGSSGEDPIGQPNFGLGLVGDKKVGWYLLKTANGQADGQVRPIIESNDGNNWSDATHPGLIWQVNSMRTLSASTGSEVAPMPMRVMTMDIQVETVINRIQFLPSLNQEIPLDGSATLDVVYL